MAWEESGLAPSLPDILLLAFAIACRARQHQLNGPY